MREQTDSLKALERMITKAGRALAALPSRWPVRGAVNSEFGNRPSPWTSGNTEFHAGLDIKADRGTPVYAPAAGSVVHAGTATEYGTAVVLEHSHDVRTLYGHLSKVNVQPGQQRRARRGDRLLGQHRPLHGTAPALRSPGQRPSGEPSRLPLGLALSY